MPHYRDHPAAEFLRNFPVRESETVSLQRVIAQRAAFAELSATALLEPSIEVLLAKTCAVAARACACLWSKFWSTGPRTTQPSAEAPEREAASVGAG